ncbi:MAG: hypothetical protein H7333_08820, partial [Bdellovibrionales bacterium]|nr:hypothetical protein [Oligoflexia bacterium]
QALCRDVKKRFQSAEEVAKALRKLLAVEYSDFGPSDLASFTKKLFHDLIVEDRKQVQSLNAQAEALLTLTVPVVSRVVETSNAATLGGHEPKEHTRVTNLGNKFEKLQITSADRVEISGHQKQMKVPARQMSASAAQPVAHRINYSAPQPVLMDDYADSGRSNFVKLAFAMVLLLFGGFFGYEKFAKQSPSTHIERELATQAEAPAPVVNANAKMANVKLRLFPDGDLSHTRVTINSAPFDFNKGFMPVPLGELVTLVVDRPGFVTFRKEFTVKESELDNKDYSMDVKLDPMVYGTLTLSTQPEVADVTIISLDQGTSGNSQKPVILKTPIYQEKLPVGHYKVIVKNELLNVEKVFQVEVKEGDRLVRNSIPLEPARVRANR